MELKLNIEKKGLSTTEEVIKEEHTLNYGVVFRGKDGKDGKDGVTPLLDIKHGFFYVSYDNGRSWDNLSVASGIIHGTTYLHPITHSQLKEKRDAGLLVPGTYYRITDFVTTTKQTGTQSAMHPYDIIVQALDEHTLSENAQAIQREGDTYFAKSNLKAWRLKYSLEGDASRFAWAKETARNQSWQCTWGVLESKPNNEASSNYTIAQIEGQTKYLYRPDSPSTFLESKQFYRMVGKETIYVEDYQDVAFVTTESPFDVGGESLTLIAIHMPTTQILGTWPSSSDWGGEEEYNVGFGEEDGSIFDMVTNGSTIEIAGQTYFSWKPYGEDYDMISSWINDNNPFVISEGTKEYYNGDNNSLFYAFDTALSRATTYVREVSDGVHLYNCEGEETFDYITYKSFVSQEEGGKGVVYRLIDEFGNDCPYDFKNIQLKNDNSWHYTFDNYGADRSLSKECFGNCLAYSAPLYAIACYIFKGETRLNYIGVSVNDKAVFRGGCVCNRIINTTIKSISAIGTFEYNHINGAVAIDARDMFSTNKIEGSVDIVTMGDTRFNTFRSVSADQRFEISGGFFYNSLYAQNRNSTPVVLSAGRMQYCDIYGAGTLRLTDANSLPKGAMSYAKIEFGMNGSNVRLVTNATTSLNARLEGIRLMAQNWGEAEQVVDITSFPTNSTYPLNIAKNKAGVVKVWTDADLAI